MAHLFVSGSESARAAGVGIFSWKKRSEAVMVESQYQIEAISWRQVRTVKVGGQRRCDDTL